MFTGHGKVLIKFNWVNPVAGIRGYVVCFIKQDYYRNMLCIESDPDITSKLSSTIPEMTKEIPMRKPPVPILWSGVNRPHFLKQG